MKSLFFFVAILSSYAAALVSEWGRNSTIYQNGATQIGDKNGVGENVNVPTSMKKSSADEPSVADTNAIKNASTKNSNEKPIIIEITKTTLILNNKQRIALPDNCTVAVEGTQFLLGSQPVYKLTQSNSDKLLYKFIINGTETSISIANREIKVNDRIIPYKTQGASPYRLEVRDGIIHIDGTPIDGYLHEANSMSTPTGNNRGTTANTNEKPFIVEITKGTLVLNKRHKIPLADNSTVAVKGTQVLLGSQPVYKLTQPHSNKLLYKFIINGTETSISIANREIKVNNQIVPYKTQGPSPYRLEVRDGIIHIDGTPIDRYLGKANSRNSNQVKITIKVEKNVVRVNNWSSSYRNVPTISASGGNVYINRSLKYRATDTKGKTLLYEIITGGNTITVAVKNKYIEIDYNGHKVSYESSTSPTLQLRKGIVYLDERNLYDYVKSLEQTSKP